MAQPYVFISYSRQDRSFVERLTSTLNEAGIKTWVDIQNIAAGLNWQEELQRGLFKADVLLYVSSVHSVDSGWMHSELRTFMDKNGRIIPLIIDEHGARNLPPFLKEIQWIDFRENYYGGVQSLLGGIHSLKTNQPVTQLPEVSKGYVFVSYATEDIDFVKGLKDFLAERGYTYWDFHSSKRNYQTDYTLELEERIRDAEATLSVVSPSWKKSRTALQELHFSNEIGTPVFLLRLKDPGPTLALAGLTFIDFTQSREVGFAKLDEEMRTVGL